MNWLLRKLTLIVFWLVVAVIGFFALFAISFGQLLPYLDSYRPQIEHNLQQITGYPVTLNEISGHLEGVDPTFLVKKIQLEVSDNPAVEIDEIRIRIDLLESFLSFSPQFTYLRFIRPTISLEEKEGTWQLNGVQPVESASDEVSIERVLDYLSAQHNLSVLDAKIRIFSEKFDRHNLDIPQLYILQKEFGSLVTSTLYLDDYKKPFEINARLDKVLFDDGYQVKASIQTPVFSIPFQASHSVDAPKSVIELGGDIWVDALIDKSIEIRAESTSLNVAFHDGQKYDASPSIKGLYDYATDSMRLDVNSLSVTDQSNKTFPTTNLSVNWDLANNTSILRFNQIDLGLSHKISSYFLPVTSEVSELINGLSPEGVVKNASLNVRSENKKVEFDFLSNFEGASVNGYNGIPKANQINAVFKLSNKGGAIQFEGQGSNVGFTTVYKDIWVTDFLSGSVDWNVQEDVFVVIGEELFVDRNGAEIKGGFRLEVPEIGHSWISLDLHGNNIPASDRVTYIPDNVLDKDLLNWLKNSISDDGVANTANVLIHSELYEGATPHVRVEVEASELNVSFSEDWPTAKKVNGNFEFGKSGVLVQVNNASLLDVPVKDIIIEVPIKDGSSDWLNVQGQFDDSISNIMRVLDETPLKDDVLSPFSSWEAQGMARGAFNVSVPFLENVEPEVQLSLQFKDNDLRIKDLNVSGFIKDGTFNYSTDKGITETSFDFEALGGASRLELHSSSNKSGGLVVEGDLIGTADINEVSLWQELPDIISSNISGKTDYTGRFFVNQVRDGQFDLLIMSDLKNTVVDLPTPFEKKSIETTQFLIGLVQYDDEFIIDIDYGDISKAHFNFQDKQFTGGQVVIGENKEILFAGEVAEGLSLAGNVNRLNVSDWESLLVESQPNNSNQKIQSDSLKVPEWINNIDFIVDEVVINPQNTLNNFKVSFERQNNSTLYVSSDEIGVTFSNNDDVPNLHFDFLSWNTDTEEQTNESLSTYTASPIKAHQIPNTLLISIDQLFVDQQPYGDWKFNVERDGESVRIAPISTLLNKGEFNGRLIWLDKGEDSKVTLSLDVDGSDLGELTGKFSSDALVTSEQYSINTLLSWNGHPFHFDRPSVNGQINFHAEDGNFNTVDELPPFLKILGVFNTRALVRRLSLDFSDVYKDGLTFDDFHGELSVYNGILKTELPIMINSPSAILSVSGVADLVEETLDETLTATFPLSGALPLAGLLWGTPQLAGLLFITDQLFGNQISKVTSIQYKVEGPFEAPTLTPVKYQPSN